MSQKFRLLCVAIVLALVAITNVPASAAAFQITIKNLSNNVLSPTPFISHNTAFDLFDKNAFASTELEMLVEDGVTSGVVSLANAAKGIGDVASVVVTSGGPILPGESRTVSLTADPAHPLLTFASMLMYSNDAFIGAAAGDSSFSLFHNGLPIQANFIISFLDVWDAGTEMDDELAVHVPGLGSLFGAGLPENGKITQPHLGITGTNDIPLSRDWYGYDVAQIIIVPEPSSLAVLAAGMAGVVALVRRRL